MEKAYESERIYEINSVEWFLGRLLGMPQSQIQKSLEKTKPQHIAANHSLQMISNLEKKLSELRGEIYQTMRKGPEEDERYNPVNDMPTGIAYGQPGNPVRSNSGRGGSVVPDYPEDPRYPPENWNNDQDPRLQRIGVSQTPPMSIEDIMNGGKKIRKENRIEMPSNINSKTSQTPLTPPDEDINSKTPQKPQTPPDEDADGPLGGSPRDVGSYGKNEPDYSNIKLPPMKPFPQPIGPKIDQNKPKMVPPALRNKIPPRGDFNSPLAPTARDNNELKASFGGNTHETYRLLEDDGHVLRRGLTAENYEMIKGLAVVLRISETEVLHRLEKNGAL